MKHTITKDIISQNSNFIIFGAGNISKKVSAVLKNIDKNILCYLISGNPLPGETIGEHPIYSIHETNKIRHENIPVIIAVCNREKNSNISIIIDLLKQKGFNQIITYFEFHANFAYELGDFFWLTKPSFYIENQSKYIECLSLFKEEQSKNLYKEIIVFCDTFNPFLLSEPDFDHQYFPENLTVWDGLNTFIDVGTYDGQNIIDAAKKFGVLSKVIAFEPDQSNLKKIKQFINWPAVASEAIIYPCGVWSETCVLSFYSGGGESSAVSEQGDLAVPVVSLDDVLQGVVPGFIKMDVEGAEIEALNGAKNLIFNHKPSLAISIYHTPKHLFEIPLLLNSWDLGYKFYIRFHGHNLFDTVLYCVL